MDENWGLLGAHLKFTGALTHLPSPQLLVSSQKIDLMQVALIRRKYVVVPVLLSLFFSYSQLL